MQNQNINLPARERIILKAHDLFYQYGIRATGVDRIIAETPVTKVTLYRHFPSKNDLIKAFLEYRHQRWMDWFIDALDRHGDNAYAISPAMSEWFDRPDFRGCAFINAVTELGVEFPEITKISRHHKQEMQNAIEHVLPYDKKYLAEDIAIAVDGAIIKAQFEPSKASAIQALDRIIKAMLNQ